MDKNFGGNMPNNYCSSCGTEVIESMKMCPNCGNKTFSASPINIVANAPSNSNQQNQPFLDSNSNVQNQQVPQSPDKKESFWTWAWFFQIIIISIIMKFFGPIGGITAFLVYFWQKPKIGKWPAMGIAAVAGILVPLVFLGLMKS